ncbi:MAG: hypothetical protein QOG64_2762 [Acidimicrobiaceae bacterium]|nr:hypothetical protein [Acidimicrobiaceae bacterium]
MSGGPRWISEADVVAALDMGAAIAALRDGLAAEARGDATNMVKTHAVWGTGHTLHAIGATFPGDGFVGTKTWAHTAGGAEPLLVLFRAEDGGVEAIIEAFALGQLRTAAVSGLATDLLAAEGASVLAIIGTGKQALPQVAAVAAVRPLAEVRVFSPDPDHRAAFARRVEAELGLPAVAVVSAAAAVDGAGVVTLATRATTPFLDSRMATSGSHINAIGAITPERAEFVPDVLERCDVVTADSVDQARSLSSELRTHFTGQDARHSWDRVIPLHTLVADVAGRPPGADLTLCKAMGMGISDLALGLAVLRHCREDQLRPRTEVPARVRVPLRLRTVRSVR